MRYHPIDKVNKMHTGVDIAAPTGTPITPPRVGKVTFAGVKGGYGNAVIVDVGGGYTVLFGHLSKIDVAIGASVDAKSILGKVGMTGKATGPHLHVEVRKNGVLIDPKKLYKF